MSGIIQVTLLLGVMALALLPFFEWYKPPCNKLLPRLLESQVRKVHAK